MKIGYLHMGALEHGVCRYSRLLAAEAYNQEDLSIAEAHGNLSENPKYNQTILCDVAQKLSDAKIVHIQYCFKNNKPLWGEGLRQLNNLRLFRENCKCQLVVTLHDIYGLPPSIKDFFKYLYYLLESLVPFQNKSKFVTPDKTLINLLSSAKNIARSFRNIHKNIADILALYWLLRQATLIFVCSEEEFNRLAIFANTKKIKIIPHFVEQRSIQENKEEAQKILNLSNYRIVTLLGYIHARKGHQLLIQALSQLPQDVKVIFAGGSGPGNEAYIQELLALAKEQGVSDRLQITGYLSEKDLERYLVATDLAVCPFKFFSASGSLSTWISIGRPILSSDLPQISEYNKIEADAIMTFQPYTSDALANAIISILSNHKVEKTAIKRLCKQLSISAIFDQHLKYYRQIIPFSQAIRSSV